MPISWNGETQRDLLLAIIVANLAEKSGTDIKCKIAWGPVVEEMKRMGHVDATSTSIRYVLLLPLDTPSSPFPPYYVLCVTWGLPYYVC